MLVASKFIGPIEDQGMDIPNLLSLATLKVFAAVKEE